MNVIRRDPWTFLIRRTQHCIFPLPTIDLVVLQFT